MTESLPPLALEPQGPEISMVAPLFNEQANIGELYRRASLALQALGVHYELVLVNDGSGDATPRLLAELQAGDNRVMPLHLSRNFGHQAAISAGLDHARGRAVVVLDGDLQDPPEVLGQMVAAWRAGHEVVYAVRTKRKESLLKRTGYAVFYRLLRAISDLDIPLDSGDFCLMDRKVVDVLKHLPERQRFVRGLRSFVGFRQTGVCYERDARNAGQPKYTVRALVRLALDGLINFSGLPLNLVGYLGAGLALLSGVCTVAFVISWFGSAAAVAGWGAVLLCVLYATTLELISLGVMSQYLRRIFTEVKGRPTYIVRDQSPEDAAARLPRLLEPIRSRSGPSGSAA